MRVADIEIDRDHTLTLFCEADQTAKVDAMFAEIKRLRALYNDLIMCVGNKHPGESRHETAKRYLINAESPVISTASAALKEPK